MNNKKLDEFTKILQDKYPESGIDSIELDDSGKATFNLRPTKSNLAFLEKEKAVSYNRGFGNISTITRDYIMRDDLDLVGPKSNDPHSLFKRAMDYYNTNGIVGTTINLKASLAAKGFENDIDDENIKNFYDVWCLDVNFKETIDNMFLDLFKVGNVVTYKAIAKYEPRISNISPNPGKGMKRSGKETSAKKNIWSKGFLPIAYTILNPLFVKIESSLLFDKNKISYKPPKELEDILKKKQSELSDEERLILKAIPTNIKDAARKGEYVALDPRLVSSVAYRKQPYELYGKPSITRVFDSLEYKKALKNADLSTLDGISNYILKVTIGNDEYPVTDQTQLETVAELFNTPSKSFDVVWNHTLNIEKIVSPEIGDILGKSKYEQVNEDITGGLGISRALIDGEGHINAAEAQLIVKGLIEEIEYARRQVERWIYKEYRQIAEVMGFDRFPKIRWDESALNDTILFMSTISQLVDRRMLSYQTALESLGFDYSTEKQNMENELPIVLDGTFGLRGSPFQQSSNGIQNTQEAPTGTPSNGRPTGQPAKTKEKETDTQKITKNKSKSGIDLNTLFNSMNDDELKQFISGFISAFTNKET